MHKDIKDIEALKAIELAFEQCSPYIDICNKLIEESYSNIKYLTKLFEVEEDILIHYLTLFGGHYISTHIADNDPIKSSAIAAYEDGETALEELSKISKSSITLDQAKCLGAGLAILHETYLDTDNVLINWLKWTEAEQFEKFSELLQAINKANFYIGQAMGSILQAKNLELHKVNGIHFKGGEVRSRIYEEKKKEAIRLYEAGSYHTYIGCGRKICDQLGVVPETIARWLSEHYSRK